MNKSKYHLNINRFYFEFRATLGYILASIMTDATTMQASLIAAAINIAYICVYLFYANAKDRTAAWRQISSGLAFLAAILAYTLAENPKVLPSRLRLINTIVILLPFLVLVSFFNDFSITHIRFWWWTNHFQRGIIRKKCTDGLPFLLTLSATVISFLWLLYGIATHATYSIIQNGLICLLNVMQLSLFVIFPSKVEKEKVKVSTDDPKQVIETELEKVRKQRGQN